MASVTSPAGEEELVVLYEITVRVGKQELAGARRRYREFHKLHHVLSENYPHLLADASSSSYDPHDEGAGPLSVTPPRPRTSSVSVALPPFPRKHLFRAGWDPAVVIERIPRQWRERPGDPERLRLPLGPDPRGAGRLRRELEPGPRGVPGRGWLAGATCAGCRRTWKQ